RSRELVAGAGRPARSARALEGALAVRVADAAAARRPDPSAGLLPIRSGTGGAGRRLLSFASGRIQLDLEVWGRGRLLNIIGQLTGGAVHRGLLPPTRRPAGASARRPGRLPAPHAPPRPV